jgi:hypothetical protein
MTIRLGRAIIVIGALCLVISPTGCKKGTGTVSGKVTFGGKPVGWGTVSVFASDNIQYTGQLSPEGTYSIPGVPNGPCRITVASPNPDLAKGGGPPAAGLGEGGAIDGDVNQTMPAPADWVQIPEKYGHPDQSGLTAVVNSNTTIDLNLD